MKDLYSSFNEIPILGTQTIEIKQLTKHKRKELLDILKQRSMIDINKLKQEKSQYIQHIGGVSVKFEINTFARHFVYCFYVCVFLAYCTYCVIFFI